MLLIGWGGTGHSKISQYASLSYNSEMDDFNAWNYYLTSHASDADIRKKTDNTEGPKHYIDIDNYPEFVSNGSIPQNIVAAVSIHGKYFVFDNGILPWATQAAFDSLRNSMKRYDWTKAKQFAADLGHYVADGHMPLHITDNYDGYNTGNDGIHYRYESAMVNSYSSLISYTGTSAQTISDVNQYIFDYIYKNNSYVDSILDADTYAVSMAGGIRNDATYNSTTYKQALWDQTRKLTIKLFKNGSHALAELIYTAWVQAGKPSLTSSDIDTPLAQFTESLEQNWPNPFSTQTTIKYNLSENSVVSLQIKDVLGNNVATLYKGYKPAGSYSIDWYPQNQHEGLYFIVLDTKKIHSVKKMMLTK